eukprot:gene14862-17046_t
MSKSTKKREQRCEILKEILCDYLEIPSDSIKPTQYRSEVYKVRDYIDGGLEVPISILHPIQTNEPTAATTEEEHRPVHLKSHWEGPYLGMLLSLEIRSELAGNNTVGMFAMGNYVDSLAKNLAAACNSHAPCLLLTVAGPYLNIDVAAFTTAAVIDPAVGFLPMLVNPHDAHSMVRIAQILRATKVCLHELDAYYRNELTEVPESERIQLAFPYMRHFVCTFLGQAVTVHFQYLRQLVHPKLVFLVKVTHVQHTLSDEQSSRFPLQVGAKFVIKFTRTYCKEAHIHCYNHNFGAPELYGIGPLPGGWLYVCMEYIERMSWLDLMYRRDVKEALRGLVAHLHSANYVHGDIKRMNVLVTEPPEKPPRVCLCDFDWAGLEGVAKYPAFITPDISLPDGVEDLKPILKEHDMHAVNTGFWNHL